MRVVNLELRLSVKMMGLLKIWNLMIVKNIEMWMKMINFEWNVVHTKIWMMSAKDEKID